MFELVKVSMLNVKEQASVRRFEDRAEAVEEANRRRKTEPLQAFYVFVHLSPFCRILTHSTL